MSRRIVITGGSFGMGRATAEAFLKEGDKVLFTARRTEKAEEFLRDYQEYVDAGKLFFLQSDISRDEDVLHLAEYAKEVLGGCDVLVNNAAVALGGLVHETDMEVFDYQFNINFRGQFLACKCFLPGMLEQKSGCIINMASDAGIRGSYNLAVYAATKAAMISLTRSMALDYGADGIRVNCICPSATQTPMFLDGQREDIIQLFIENNPAGRLGKAEDIANTIVFLASDKADYIRGQIISVDGGLSAWCGEARQTRRTDA